MPAVRSAAGPEWTLGTVTEAAAPEPAAFQRRKLLALKIEAQKLSVHRRLYAVLYLRALPAPQRFSLALIMSGERTRQKLRRQGNRERSLDLSSHFPSPKELEPCRSRPIE